MWAVMRDAALEGRVLEYPVRAQEYSMGPGARLVGPTAWCLQPDHSRSPLKTGEEE